MENKKKSHKRLPDNDSSDEEPAKLKKTNVEEHKGELECEDDYEDVYGISHYYSRGRETR